MKYTMYMYATKNAQIDKTSEPTIFIKHRKFL